ncbi:MAG: C40 family peptidase [Pyrinomonadaceae bacterium]
MIDLKKASAACFAAAAFAATAFGQSTGADRPRVVRSVSSQPVNQPAAPPESQRPLVSTQPTSRPSRPVLTNDISIPERTTAPPLVKATASSRATNAMNGMGAIAAGRMVYSSGTSNLILRGIQSRLGIPYLYGSSGPNRYDCSGFVWAVFRDAGVGFIRSSARSLWEASVPVTGDDRYKFGTLVFMNRLGHMGIVADENGFYHASSSKGITYSPFKGYWEKRIVGFRRLPEPAPPTERPIEK